MTETDRRNFIKQAGGALAAMAIIPEFAMAMQAEVADGVGVGIVGMGRQGRAIAGELQKIKGVRITSICDVDPGRLRSGSRRVAHAATFDRHEKLLEQGKDVTVVIIATPTHAHRRVVEDALAAGKHVYCEAPLASTVEDCRAIVAATRGAPTVCAAGLLARSNPVYQLARTFFLSDSVRDLMTMRAQSNQKATWRSPALDPAREKALNWRLDPELSIGLAGELGTHQFDVFHYYRGLYPSTVQGRGAVRLYDDGREIADTINCMLGFDDGPVLQYQATLGSTFEGTHEVLFGSNAAIKLAWTHGWMFKEADAPVQGWEVYANRQQFHNDEGITLIADATKLASQGKLETGVGLPHPPLYYGLVDFLMSVTEDRPVATTVEEGARATLVGILADQAVRTGEPIAIDPELLAGT